MDSQNTLSNQSNSIENTPQDSQNTETSTNEPLFIKNYLGTVQCKLCATIHTNEETYNAHTLGKRHQLNLLKTQRED